jgi:hypothetical protein
MPLLLRYCVAKTTEVTSASGLEGIVTTMEHSTTLATTVTVVELRGNNTTNACPNLNYNNGNVSRNNNNKTFGFSVLPQED